MRACRVQDRFSPALQAAGSMHANDVRVPLIGNERRVLHRTARAYEDPDGRKTSGRT